MLTSIRSLLAAAAIAGRLSFRALPPPRRTLSRTQSRSPSRGNVSLTTDYRFRGVSLSGGDPAIQGGITATHDSGFYVGAWSSSITAARFTARRNSTCSAAGAAKSPPA